MQHSIWDRQAERICEDFHRDLERDSVFGAVQATLLLVLFEPHTNSLSITNRTTIEDIDVNTFLYVLFSDAEGRKDSIEDVVGGGGAGDFVEGTKHVVEI